MPAEKPPTASETKTQIETRRLGRTGLDLSILGLGGHMSLPNDGKENVCILDHRVALVRYLVSRGVNYFDTTWINEVRVLAETLRRAGLGPGLHVAMQYANAISKPDWREKLRQELESRLEIMGYGSAPLFAMGVGNGHVTYEDLVAAAEALAALKSEGIVGKIGIASHRNRRYADLARLIEETDLIDYVLVRFNWKHREAKTDLFDVAARHNVGVILVKLFRWDRGPGQWHRRINVFEPLSAAERAGRPAILSPAQRSLIWTLRQNPSAHAVCSMSALWEAEQNLGALDRLGEDVDTSDFEAFARRLWSRDCLTELARRAENASTREHALEILESM